MQDLQAYMNDAVTNFRRGTTEMLLLSMLRNGERFATDMAHELAEKCVGTFDLQIVHVAQIMRRLRDAGFVGDRVQPSENGRLKFIYYHLLPLGEAYLNELMSLYRRFDRDIETILAQAENEKEGQ